MSEDRQTHPVPDYLQRLNPRQREAVLHTGAPLLILAGAGSGKTRVITTKIAHLIDRHHFDPRSILAVAFTNKAAEQMRERAQALTPLGSEVMIKTFHSFGAWLLRRYGLGAGIPRNFTIYDEQDCLALLRRVVQAQPSERKPRRGELRKAAGWIARAKDRCLLPSDDLSEMRRARGLSGLDMVEVYRLYQDRLEQSGSMDFGDLIVRAVKLLETDAEVRDKMRSRFRAILVDEYQDSNFSQFRLLEQLYDGSNYLCVVGDEDQSIYSFRGAELENILSFSDSFPGTEIIRLEESFRCTENILEVASRVVERNRNRLGKTLFTRRPSGLPVSLAYLDDPEAEALFCAEKLRDGRLAQSAILYRMNFQSRVFESIFSRLGIPFRVVGTVRFYEREEVKDALAYLTLIVNPSDEIAFRRAVGKPRRGIGSKTVEKILSERDSEGSLLAAAEKAVPSLRTKAAKGLERFISLMDSLKSALAETDTRSLGKVVQLLIMESGLVKMYRERDQAEGTNKVQNLEELVNATSEYPGTLEGLSLFLETLMLGGTDENPFRSSGKVTLITAHNTKGLEFDRVFITGLEDGVFPHYSSTVGGLPVAGEELEEERRLFYVGVTRARDELLLTACKRRRVFGTMQVSEPSRFLSEVPREHLYIYNGSEPRQQDSLPLGCGVYHDEYGPGIISNKWEAEGVLMVSVRFDSGKIARFPLKYSRLERVSRDP